MRILELVEQMAQQLNAQGSLSSVTHAADPVALPAGTDVQWRPAPDPTDGSLVQDPDFTLPTTAGPLAWRLFHDSNQAGVRTEWGWGRDASFPLRLTSDGTTVTVMHEDGSSRQYQKVGGNFVLQGAATGDTLVQNGDNTWDETLGATGLQYHYPAGNMVSVAYRATPQGLRITYNYDGNQLLQSIVEPAGRRITLGYVQILPNWQVESVQDWGNRRNTLSYTNLGNLQTVKGPTGCFTEFVYRGDHRIDHINDPEGYRTSYTYDYAGRVLTRSVSGNLGRYTYQVTGSVVTTAYTDPLGRTWTHLTSGGYPSGQIDPLGNRQTYTYVNGRPLEFIDGLGNSTSYAWDSNGFQTARRDGLGNRWTYTRDSYGNLLSSTNPLGYLTTYSYGGNAQLRQLESVADALGRRTTYSYLASGLRESAQDMLGNRTTWVWSNLGLLDAVVNPLGNRMSYFYDSVANQTGRMNALGNRWTATFDLNSRRTSEQNPLGAIWTTIYDSRGLVQAEVDPLGHRTTSLYNAFASRIQWTNALGNDSSWDYNGANELTDGVDALNYRTTYLYDLAGKRTGVQDARGYWTTTVYDAANQAIARVDALGYRTTTQYDAAGRPQAILDALGNRQTTVYDAASQAIARLDALGNGWTTVYDAAGAAMAQIDPLSYRTTTQYEARGLVEAQIDALGYRTTYQYDAAQRAVASQDALASWQTTVYDAADQWLASVDPLGARTTAVYDAAGQTVATVDALGNRSTTVYDVAGRTQATQDAGGYFTTLVYDAADQPIALVDGNGNRTTSQYDARGGLAATRDALAAWTTFQYDGAGNRVKRTDARGWATTYTVDARNQTTGQLYRDGSRVTMSYDALSRPAMTADVTGVSTQQWDAVGRLAAAISPGGKTLTYSYSGRGERTLLVDPDGGRTTYNYSARAELLQVVNPFAETTSLAYDPNGQEISKVLANGVVVSRAYDATGNELVRQYLAAGGTALAAYTATYDGVGNRQTVLELDASRVTYAYDPSSQLILEQRSGANAYSTSYQYDRVGNRQVKNDSGQLTTSVYNAANGLTLTTPPSGPPTTVSWDANGNLVGENAGGSLTTYTWDPENRLIQAAFADGTRSTYSYSADGKRKQAIASPPVNFLWDGENLLQETDVNGVTQVQYTQSPDRFGGLTSQRRGGVSSFHGFDLQAHTRMLVSAGGQITDGYVYKAFGEDLAVSGSTVNWHKCFGEEGYYCDLADRPYVRTRYLHNLQGRWMSRDPLRFRGGDGNLYRYVGNNAPMSTDPSGLIRMGFGKRPPGPFRGTIPNDVFPCLRDCRSDFFLHDPVLNCSVVRLERVRVKAICDWDRAGLSGPDLPPFGERRGTYPDEMSSPFPQADTFCCVEQHSQPKPSKLVVGCINLNPQFNLLPLVYQICVLRHEKRRWQNCYWYADAFFEAGSYYGSERDDVARILECVKNQLLKCGFKGNDETLRSCTPPPEAVANIQGEGDDLSP